MSIKKIAVVMAMMDEAQPFIEALSLVKNNKTFPKNVPMEVYGGAFNNIQVFLIWNGIDTDYGVDNVGTQPATLATYLAASLISPDIIISAGTAGALNKRGANIGDVYLSCGVFRYHDRRIPYTGFPEYGVGSYPSADVSRMANDLGLKLGEVSSGNSLETIDRDLEIILESGSILKEMEAAAVAWVCKQFSIPMFSIKAVVDLLDTDQPSYEQFADFLHMGSKNLQKALLDVIKYCDNKNITELSRT